MIKQAYFRGLTKVAGGYSGWNPTTWSLVRNPLSGVIDPIRNFVKSGIANINRSSATADKPWKKLLQGGIHAPGLFGLTPDG